ncbi:MAG: hypothetical protein H6618_04430 [Deltaproteobacteria bacterium]|nr:hypothetical protein [Deltaproteobacteria bacterium]
MGIEAFNLPVIIKASQQVKRKERLLFFGYPNIFLSPGELSRNFGKKIRKNKDISAKNLGEALGYQDILSNDFDDRADYQKNLNEPLPEEFTEQFDLVIDTGVLFWCFSPGAAFRNMASCLRTGGAIVHICALTGHIGRGYYNIHPRAFLDFYTNNGFHHIATSVTSKRPVPSAFNKIRGGTWLAKQLGFGNKTFSVPDAQHVYARQKGSVLQLTPEYTDPGLFLSGTSLGTYAFLRTQIQDLNFPDPSWV